MSNCKRAISSGMALKLLLALAAVLTLTGSGWAQALNTTFEIDGNPFDEIAVPGEDWDSLYHGIGTYDVYTGLIPDAPNDTNRFFQGSKDILDIPGWAWDMNAVPDKNELTNGQAAFYTPGTSKFLYFQGDRYDNSGDAFLGFWFLQDSVNFKSDGTFTGVHKVGDILILAQFSNGGVVDSLAVYEWVGSGGDSDDSLKSDGNDAFNVIWDKSIVFAAVNQDTFPSPWPFQAKGYPVANVFPISCFFEGALNLGALFNDTIPCFSSFIIESRSSTSLTAELKDVIRGGFSFKPQITVNSDTICAGDSTLLCATITPGTGIAPFHYAWNTGDTTACIYAKTGGNYIVTVTSDNGCSSGPDTSVVVVTPAPILSLTGDVLTCDSTTGSACVTVTNSGSTGPVHYVWTGTGLTGSDTLSCARFTAAGWKHVTVTTLNGCSTTDSVEITTDYTRPDLVATGDVLTCDSTQASTCVTDNASLPSVSYLWSGTGLVGASNASCARWSSAGIKTVIVTNLATGCKDTATAEITTDYARPDLVATGDVLTCDSTNASTCVTDNNSLPSVSYSWSGTGLVGASNAACARWSAAGIKTVIVTNLATGCTDTATAEITTDYARPDLVATGDVLTCDSTNASTCVTDNNSLPSVSYLWSGTGLVGASNASCARWSEAGTKTVIVTNLATGCKDTATAEITTDFARPDLVCTGDVLTCDSTQASTSVTDNNSLPSVSYLWSGTGLVGSATGATARWSSAGIKTVIVTNLATGCSDTCEAEITADNSKPDLSCTGDVLTCDSTQASTSVTDNAGLPSVSYSWSGTGLVGSATGSSARWSAAGTKTVIVTNTETGCKDTCEAEITTDYTRPDLVATGDVLTCDSTAGSTCVTDNNSLPSVSYSWSGTGLIGASNAACARWNAAGTKTVIVTNLATGCSDTATAEITTDYARPDLIATGDVLTCDSTAGSTCVTDNNSLPSVTYLWSGSGLIGASNASCARWNAAGTKTVIVTNLATGCSDTATAEITTDYTRPDLVATGDVLTCDSTNASTCVTDNNSLPSVSYAWSGTGLVGASNAACARWSLAGTKTVIVTNLATGCSDTATAEVTPDNARPDLVCSGDVLTCDSTQATTSVTDNAALPSVSYLWSGTGLVGSATGATARWSAAGIKTVIVTNLATGCTDTCTAEITTDYARPDLACTGDVLTCDSTNATTSVTDNAALPSVSYLWSGTGLVGSATGATARWSAAGTKTVIVTNLATGCKDTCTAEITTDYLAPEITCAGDTLTCDSTNASTCVTVTNEGDLGTLTYAWTGDGLVSGGDSACARWSVAGAKTIIVTNTATGCKDTCEATIAIDTLHPAIAITPGDTTVCDGESVTFCAMPSGGVTPYVYAWTGPNTFTSTDSCITVTDTGSYVIILTGANGCKDTATVHLQSENCGGFCSYTQGGWGSGCPDAQKADMMSTQPGCIRDHYFSTVFPNGVTIGDPNQDGGMFFGAKWTTAPAIEAFLPAGKTPKTLTQDYLNPSVTSAGVLAGQLLALKLNVGFSCAGIFTNLHPEEPAGCYGDLVISSDCSDKFGGITVDSLIVIADKVISGDKMVLKGFNGAVLGDLNSALTCLNELWDECHLNTEPSTLSMAEVTVPDAYGLSQNYPNPFNPTTKINFSLPTTSHVTIEIFNVLGQKVTTLLNETRGAGNYTVAWDATKNASGIYFYRMTTDSFTSIKKMLLLK